MRSVRSKDTAPELLVRKLVHRLGFRFRLHRKDLPGTPDLVFPRLRKVLFVHGCFWHGHDCRRGARVPKTNTLYWSAKIGRNRMRDRKSIRELRKLGWVPLVLWECQIFDDDRLARRLQQFLAPGSPPSPSGLKPSP